MFNLVKDSFAVGTDELAIGWFACHCFQDFRWTSLVSYFIDKIIQIIAKCCHFIQANLYCCLLREGVDRPKQLPQGVTMEPYKINKPTALKL